MRRALLAVPVLLVLAAATGAGAACRQLAGIDDIELAPLPEAGPPPDLDSGGPTDAGPDVRDAISPVEAMPEGCAPFDAAGGCGCPCCTTLASGLDVPLSFVRVGDDFYVLNYGVTPLPGSLVRVPSDGGSVETVASNLQSPYSLTTDGTELYFLGKNPEAGSGSYVERVPTGGGKVEVLAPARTSAPAYGSLPINTQLVTSDGTVYWATATDVRSVQTDGGGAQVFMAGFPDASFATGVFFAPYALAIGNGKLYLDTGDTQYKNIVIAVTLASYGPKSTAQQIASGVIYGSAQNVALSGTQLYYVESPYNETTATPSCTNGTVWRATADGGVGVNVAQALPSPWALTIDDGGIYVANNGANACSGTAPGSVVVVPFDGGKPTTIAGSAAAPQAILTDPGYVYWVDSTCGTLMRAPK